MKKIVKISPTSHLCKFANVEVPEEFESWPEEKKRQVFEGIWKADHLDDYTIEEHATSNGVEFVQGQKYGIPRLCFTVDTRGKVTRVDDEDRAVAATSAKAEAQEVTLPEDPNGLAMAITEALTRLVGSPPQVRAEHGVWYAGQGLGMTHLVALKVAARHYLGDVAPDQEMAIAVLRAAVKKK